MVIKRSMLSLLVYYTWKRACLVGRAQVGNRLTWAVPTHHAIDRKPESGCEIKTSTCGESSIILQLRIVKNGKDKEQRYKRENGANRAFFTKELLAPWKNNNRFVQGDSYFASADIVEQLHRFSLGFIGVSKTAHRHFQARCLAS